MRVGWVWIECVLECRVHSRVDSIDHSILWLVSSLLLVCKSLLIRMSSSLLSDLRSASSSDGTLVHLCSRLTNEAAWLAITLSNLSDSWVLWVRSSHVVEGGSDLRLASVEISHTLEVVELWELTWCCFFITDHELIVYVDAVADEEDHEAS